MIVKTGSNTANITLNRAEDTVIRGRGAHDLTGYTLRLAVRNVFTIEPEIDPDNPSNMIITISAEQAQTLGSKEREYEVQKTAPDGRRTVLLAGLIAASGFTIL